MKMVRRKCRMWWPEQLLPYTSSSGLLLFGWFMDSINVLDIVVAAAIPSKNPSVCPQINLEEILKSVNGNMPVGLQESTFSMLGYCTTDFPGRKLKTVGSQKDEHPLKTTELQHCLGGEDSLAKTNICNVGNQQYNQASYLDETSSEIYGRWKCGCEFVQPDWQSLMICENRILILCRPQRILYKNNRIPYLHHIHQNGDVWSPDDVHIIIYEHPTYGASHLSLSPWHSPERVGLLLKKPNWINELHKKPILLDLDRVLLALNCTNAAKIFLEQKTGIFSPMIHMFFMSIFLRLASMLCYMVAGFVASISTFIYIFLQLFHKSLSYGPMTFFFILQKMFTHTWKNVHIRSCQFLYWPIFLQGSRISLQPNVEYAHRTSLRKHFMWSNMLMDIIFGIVVGALLLANVEVICHWISVTVHQITNDLLRSGCVWLMGVPAGFKLNNELAELIGMISLNAIQVFSTLWFYLGVFLRFYIQVLAVLGIVFGSTIPIALCIDMLQLATLHVYALHCLISFLYSQQIQALASLWRLFRGRKQNPLRQRLDSYDYTVEQHVVGSLLFTPFLLLIPTTSVFYTFFTSLITTIIFLCIILEIIISLLHATPYAEIFLWILSRRRFPSGVWFRIKYTNHEILGDDCSPTCFDRRQKDYFVDGGSQSLVLLLCSNYATLGQVIRPHYAEIFSGVTPSFLTSLAHGILSGRRFPSTLGTRLPPTMPWMQITCREYWKLAYAAVLSRRL